ncbi:HK97 family phage prohead protease [Actinacidiphila sp. ITFR-21]|uniref:HK97 family phage prohead protease n=1 Tax=Actinacidiphila sp. ITFR-21 TaxID=3075199 RepID=UPI00288AC628|nr:HK97 family phage prohead protease [Streptomyces sp. ITFR-21]WNI15568.1 HK97 family phage prohead protease [Streptomyces sp. ITFR-21]
MDLEFRSLDDVQWRVDPGDEGTFEGVACRFNVVDSYGTTFHPNAFKKGGLRGSYALLFMHDPYQPVGTFTAEERTDHLWISGRYDDTQAGQDARTMARSGSASELSVGFVRTDIPKWDKVKELSEEDQKELFANIRAVRLVETSQITARMAAVPGSKLKTVRHTLGDLYAEAGEPTLADRLAEQEQQRAAAGEEQRGARMRAAARLRLTAAGPAPAAPGRA